MPFGLQPIHLIIILIVAIILFVPKQLPELVLGLGKAIVEFRQAVRPEDHSDDKTKSASSSKDSAR